MGSVCAGIVKLLGVCVENGSFYLVQEMVNGYGNLFDFLHKKNQRLSYWQCIQIAIGMEKWSSPLTVLNTNPPTHHPCVNVCGALSKGHTLDAWSHARMLLRVRQEMRRQGCGRAARQSAGVGPGASRWVPSADAACKL